ncbi:hypothetical protein MNBD_GAMMA16-167 [hydrothermal vent metagenome]|uniref:Uncharacterized protein n=1 Tax=hydrothermal vent metagenome TaxID=652676 RepID=A0A3B0ZZ99_9ZZZZ
MGYWVLFPKTINDGAVLSAAPEGGPKAYLITLKAKPMIYCIKQQLSV